MISRLEGPFEPGGASLFCLILAFAYGFMTRAHIKLPCTYVCANKGLSRQVVDWHVKLIIENTNDNLLERKTITIRDRVPIQSARIA